MHQFGILNEVAHSRFKLNAYAYMMMTQKKICRSHDSYLSAMKQLLKMFKEHEPIQN